MPGSRSRNLKVKTPKRHKGALDVGRRLPRNELLSRKERKLKQKLASKTALYELEQPNAWLIQLAGIGRIGRWVMGCFLLPLCFVTTMALLSCFRETMDAAFWRTAPFWFFAMGLAVWVVNFFWMWRPVYFYVLGHEATHALIAWFCGGNIHEFKVTRQGGHVVTDKNNVLISLGPYFVPFYAVLAAIAFWAAGLAWDLSAWHPVGLKFFSGFRLEWVGFLILGMTWGFHLTFTVWMIAKDQPDLKTNGTFFSLNLIYLVNVLLLALLLVVAAPTVTWGSFWEEWVKSFRAVWETLGNFLSAAWKLIRAL